MTKIKAWPGKLDDYEGALADLPDKISQEVKEAVSDGLARLKTELEDQLEMLDFPFGAVITNLSHMDGSVRSLEASLGSLSIVRTGDLLLL